MEIRNIVNLIQKRLDAFSSDDYSLVNNTESDYFSKIKLVINAELENYPTEVRDRIENEFFNWGPLEPLIADEEICEILVNGQESIWFEKRGTLRKHMDCFLSSTTYRNILDRIAQGAKVHATSECPIVDGHIGPFRLNMVRTEVHPEGDILSLRRHPANSWTLEGLTDSFWCTPLERELIGHWILSEKNFLVVGPTSSGKTSILSACLQLLGENERVLILEDSSEIKIPNQSSVKLLTRKDSQGLLPELGLGELLRTALRLRPDRLIIGEMRGPEAKDFLMALSSGHRGSLGTLHAENAAQALLRLEMLVQLGAPQWNLTAIRRLIHLSLDGILVTGRDTQGNRKFNGLYSISSLEESGFTLERVASKAGLETSCSNDKSFSSDIF